MEINPRLSYDRCVVMVNRIATKEHCEIARRWIAENVVIDEHERINLKLMLNSIERMIEWKEILGR